MKRFYTTLLMMVVALGMMAQGWPEKYNGVMLQAFYWDGFADAQWSRLEKQVDNLSTTFDLVWIPQIAAANRWATTTCIGSPAIIIVRSAVRPSCAP